MASSRLLSFLSLFLTYFVSLTISKLDLLYHNCYYSNNRNFTTSSPYESNLQQALNSLIENTSITSGFYNSSYGEDPDKVFAKALCRPDMEPDACRDCINVSRHDLPNLCPESTSAIGGYDDGENINCMLRYAGYNIFGVMEEKPYFFVHAPENITENVEGFNQTRQRLLEELISKAADSPKKYATGSKQASDVQTIYGLVQCTPDVDETECTNCLSSAITNMSDCCNISQGGRVYTPSCNFRYALNSKFYKNDSTSTRPPKGEKDYTVIIAVIVSVVSFVILVTAIGVFLRRRKSQEDDENVEEIKNTECLQFDFATIRMATHNFSNDNKLGQGGFGAVYKGKLDDGQQVAVKRLSMNSTQGVQEFKTEVLLLGQLQHRNLVRLLGFCLTRNERILVYEFLPNSSLNRFIFDPIKRKLVNWEMRYKIIRGIARGLLYLHEDSRLKIIHRDLKADNILLDSDMNPKIADFGLAKLFEMNQTQSQTNRLAGTRGYMAPEYVIQGRVSVKSDVYSFGVLILEIVLGQKRSGGSESEEEYEDPVANVWKRWNEGTTLNLIDPALRNGSTDAMKKCIHIGLLCVQESVFDRPDVASVIHMLNSDISTLPRPSKPGFFTQNSTTEPSPLEHPSGSTMSDQHKIELVPLVSQNECSITELHPR